MDYQNVALKLGRWGIAAIVSAMSLMPLSSYGMEQFSRVIQDQNGTALSGAVVTVYHAGTGTLASIYRDNGVTAKDNPFTTAIDGLSNFYAANGMYDVTVSHPRHIFSADKMKGISLHDETDTAVTQFPGGPFVGQVVSLLQNGGEAACTESSAEVLVVKLCAWNGSTWVEVGGSGGGARTLDQAFDGGKFIDGANSVANAVRIGDGVTPVCIFTDATKGPWVRPCIDSHIATYILPNFTYRWYDVEGDAVMFTVDPDATDNDKYVWASGYRPIKTISFPADALYPRGASTLVTDTALISGGLISPYITTTDSDSDGFYRYIGMDPKWDGGPVTATVHVVNVNATPANAFEVDVSGACYPAGTVIPTTISTTGEQPATVTFGSSGSCGGSACSQNDPASATTAAITINGTPAGGNFCGFQAQVDATATTETVAGIKITQMDIHYKISKGF